MSEPSTNVTETVVTETYYPPERDEPDVIYETTPDDIVTTPELDDWKMAEDERFTAMDGKIDGVTTALGSLAENQTKLLALFEDSKKTKPSENEPDKNPKEPAKEPESEPTPTNDPDHINSPGAPDDDPPTAPSTDPAERPEIETPVPGTSTTAPVSSGSGDSGSTDKTPKQKLGWRGALLGGSGGRIKTKSGGNS